MQSNMACFAAAARHALCGLCRAAGARAYGWSAEAWLLRLFPDLPGLCLASWQGAAVLESWVDFVGVLNPGGRSRQVFAPVCAAPTPRTSSTAQSSRDPKSQVASSLMPCPSSPSLRTRPCCPGPSRFPWVHWALFRPFAPQEREVLGIILAPLLPALVFSRAFRVSFASVLPNTSPLEVPMVWTSSH